MRDYPRYIYFLQGKTTGLIKIGMAENWTKRLKTLQASSPDALEVLTLIHSTQGDGVYLQEFSASRHHGEWFSPTRDLMDFIKSVPYTPQGVPFELFVSTRKRMMKEVAELYDIW